MNLNIVFYDAAIGRFSSIDPLADVYVYNSTYAFQENKLGLGSEFEGKEIRLTRLVSERRSICSS